jgi:hypothetical protein
MTCDDLRSRVWKLIGLRLAGKTRVPGANCTNDLLSQFTGITGIDGKFRWQRIFTRLKSYSRFIIPPRPTFPSRPETVVYSLIRAFPMLLAAGCGGSATPNVQSQAAYDPAALTVAAFAEYDRDKNGFLEGAELNACPALKGSLVGIDTNRDGKISKAELQTRFEAYKAANAGSVAVAVTITLDGAPLGDATVQFVPEVFMGSVILEATGKTRANGTVGAFVVDGTEYAGLQPGLYRVKVTWAGASGKSLPARYNTQSTLGAEVFGGRGSHSLLFALSSR